LPWRRDSSAKSFENSRRPSAQITGFERVNAEEPPFGAGDDLNESSFVFGGGRQFREMAVELLLVVDGVVRR
jgi:hypothetical protein